MNRYYFGFSLIELMATLFISTALTLTALPSLLAIKHQYRSLMAAHSILQFIQFSRNHALSYGRNVTVCPLSNNQCDNNWQAGMSAFFDSGTRNKLDGDDQLISILPAFNSQDIAYYNRKAIRFQIDGFASGTNGTFRYCPQSTSNRYSRAVIVNQAGRIRFSTNQNITCTK
ncbi:GspH/FimT family pseudopilin [Shewanella intestini]|uniref:Type II secretion system protein H n=2 Tax=Shewanella intestini TaxID=2017544 RepID=A0ABS5HY45_9GAMM|nr:GspH/FimT family pseudopilin [Shewanella sp. XMDDZSB0408]MBR9726699.1 general secretion pathway protein GspH [Shewanella intestini]MRG34735.1 general secretion pathway protein GspH [Shewanella sp. XMDDZSB0408]